MNINLELMKISNSNRYMEKITIIIYFGKGVSVTLEIREALKTSKEEETAITFLDTL